MIVVVGESLVDVPDGPDPVEIVGGAPLNVATGLGYLDIPTILVTQVGTDARGHRVVEYVGDSGIELIASPTLSGRTSTTLVRTIDGEPAYQLDLEWQLPHLELPACDALHVGSLGTVLEPGRDSVVDLVEQAWARNVFVSYDPNVRGPIDDRAQAWGDLESLADRSTLVRLSIQDVALVQPGAEPEDIARTLLTGERTELVVLTRGADGATAYTRDLQASVPAPAVTVVNTIGAGDAFTAGLLAVLYEDDAFGAHGAGLPMDRDGLERLLGAACEVASLSCARQGAAAPARSDLRPGWPG